MDDKTPIKHSITIKERRKISITGVIDVFSFDEKQLDIETIQGMLLIQGEDLHINLLNLEKGDLQIDGLVYSVAYHDNDISKSGGSFLGKLFK